MLLYVKKKNWIYGMNLMFNIYIDVIICVIVEMQVVYRKFILKYNI